MNRHTNILVCVTQQKTCERLIRKAARMCSEHNGELHVLHVSKTGWKILNNKREGEALEYLFGISKSVGADLTVLKSDDIPGSIARYAHDNNIDCLVLGQSPEEQKGENFKKALQRLAGDVEMVVIP